MPATRVVAMNEAFNAHKSWSMMMKVIYNITTYESTSMYSYILNVIFPLDYCIM